MLFESITIIPILFQIIVNFQISMNVMQILFILFYIHADTYLYSTNPLFILLNAAALTSKGWKIKTLDEQFKFS